MPEIFRACPKCGTEGIEPTWHKKCTLKNKKVVRQEEVPFVNISTNEHLHYFCKCGYDFVRDIAKKENMYE